MEEYLQKLNPQQYEAVVHGDGPLLILAGAGSGKTRVVTSRIAYLIAQRNVKPWNICAITFTNKAAGEMRERVDGMVGFGSEAINVATFHSTCVRILRRFIDRIGYRTSFDIYDTDDSRSLMREICRDMQVDTKRYRERMLLARISSEKNELIYPEEFVRTADLSDPDEKVLADVYQEYQARLRRSNALDFDDLIGLTVQLFRSQSDVLDYYQERFRYLLVDEYQDTNKAQFVFVSLLAQKYRNLCVVGDDDQSIYRFRGADIGNILNFEKVFPDATVIRLEQNYRSTQTILDAANSVIANNVGRKEKKLWTENGQGGKILLRRFETGQQEASYIVRDILAQKQKGKFDYSDSAVLYRTNAQSRALEEMLLMENIPYSIVGGVNFYARREIKDILAYLKLMDNGADDLAARRIINIPKRGIGATTITRVSSFAGAGGISFYSALQMADSIPGLGRSAGRLKDFVKFIEQLRKDSEGKDIADVLRLVIERTGYAAELKLEGTDEALERLGNIDELVNKAALFDRSFEGAGEDESLPAVSSGDDVFENADDASDGEVASGTGTFDSDGEDAFGGHTLRGFLSQVALVADIDSVSDEDNRVLLMTLHSAKGLEFPNVYLAGMDDGLFPGYLSINSDDDTDLEEERRLCYVGITRAKERLTLTSARARMLRGKTEWYRISRFVDEIPEKLLDDNRKTHGPWQERKELTKEAGDGSVQWGRTGTHMLSKAQAERKREHEEFHQKPFYSGSLSLGAGIQKGAAIGKTDSLEYGVGDRVRHVKFGEGTVMAIEDGARDRQVTVLFDTAGQKKMLAGFAKLKKI